MVSGVNGKFWADKTVDLEEPKSEDLYFANFNLGWELDMALKKLGYLKPTPIQSKSIPEALKGMDIIGHAATGTGKTAAFSIPIISKISSRRPRFPEGLVIAPTRELASQIKAEAQALGEFRKIRVVDIVGGRSLDQQARKLRKGAHIVVGTPGRILDMYKRGYLVLDSINSIVLDEADEMLSIGFYEAIEEILSLLPKKRQTFLFSATVNDKVMSVASNHMTYPKILRDVRHKSHLNKIKEFFHMVKPAERMETLIRTLNEEADGKTLIFCETKREVDYVAMVLARHNQSVEAIHGDFRQSRRDRIMGRFKSGECNLLVATDIAARGIHVDNITTIINYRFPSDPTTYVHRIGRTGRVGSNGVAITLYTIDQKYFLQDFRAKVDAKRSELLHHN